MSNHSVIEHRANYHYVKVEEDYIAICLKGEASPHCKALILSILEQWTNTKRDKHEEPVVYMTYPQWIKATYWYHGRNVIIESLQELVDAGFITRKPYHLSNGKDTFAYVLNVNAVQEAIKALPEKSPNDPLPSFNLNAFKNKRVPNQTRPKSNGSDVYNQTPDAFNKGRNITSTTQLPDTPSEESSTVSVETDAPASSSSQSKPIDFEAAQERKRPTNPQMPAITQEMLAETVKMPIVKPSQQTPIPQSQVRSTPDTVAPPASVRGTAQAGAGADLPAMALTAKQIKQQNEKRAKDIWTIIERERQTKYSRTQRELHDNSKGIECIIADDIEDETLIKALKAMDPYQRRNFTVSKFYGWIPNLTANESPPPNGKASAPADKVTTLYRNKSEELAAQREKYAAQGGY